MGSKVVIARDPSLRTPGPGVDSSRLLKLLDRIEKRTTTLGFTL